MPSPGLTSLAQAELVGGVIEQGSKRSGAGREGRGSLCAPRKAESGVVSVERARWKQGQDVPRRYGD